MRVPLFPLHTVLYPGGPLPLRIFEPRYLDMISDCLKNDSRFGVLLIESGNETGPATTCEVGTLASIVDWYQGSDGLLGITAVGGERFRMLSVERQSDGLNVGEVALIPAEPPLALPAEYQPLAAILQGVIEDLGRLYESLDKEYDNAVWVGYRFAEILPISPAQKQQCLETDDCMQRLELMREMLDSVRDGEDTTATD